MSPYFHKLAWLPKLCSSEAESERISKLVKTKVVDTMAEGVGAETEEQPDVDDTAPSNKRKRPAGPFAGAGVSEKQDDAMIERMAASGLFGDDSGEDAGDDTGPSKLSLRDVSAGVQPLPRALQSDESNKTTRRGSCFRSGPERGSRSTPTWRAWLEFCCRCRHLLPSSSGTSARLGALSPGPVAGWGRNTWR